MGITMTQDRSYATVVSVHSSGTHDFSKQPRSSIRLIANFGVEGDAHAGEHDQHLFHMKRFGQHPNLRQVHLIQSELFEFLAAQGYEVPPGAIGENIRTKDVDLLALPVRTRLHIGSSAVVELTGLRNPCVQIERYRPGLLAHLVERTQAGLVRKAGVMSVVLSGGEIAPTDTIDVELPDTPHEPLIYMVPDPILRQRLARA